MFADTTNVPVVVICYDMGETKAFKGALEDLQKGGIDYRLIAMATAEEQAEKIGYPKEKIVKLSELTGEEIKLERETTLSDSTLQKVADKIAGLKPKVVLSGAVSRAQHQVGKLFPVKMLAYYDNVNVTIANNAARKTIERFAENCTMLVPSSTIAEGISGSNKAIVGHPELEAFAARVSKINTKNVKERMRIPETAKVITFIGGYGSDYEKSLEKFSQIVEIMQTKPEWNSLHVVVQVHPKMFKEANIPEDRLPLSNLHLSKGEFTTDEALSIADLSISVGSTVTPQAACANIPSHFVIYSQFASIFVEKGLCRNLQTPEEFEDILGCGDPTQKDFLTKAGIPVDSQEKIAQAVKDSM